jgi:cholesterol transport system auxiliary component
MKPSFFVTLALGALSLLGCVKLNPKPPALLLNLTSTAKIAANEAHTGGAGQLISIAVPTTPQAIANNRVAVSDGPVAIAYIKDAAWVEPPARLFQRLLSETVAAKTGKVVLDPRQYAVDPGIQLTGQLKSFGIDARTHEAVVTFDAALSRNRGALVETRRFESRRPLASITPIPAGEALNNAANLIASEVAAWISGH